MQTFDIVSNFALANCLFNPTVSPRKTSINQNHQTMNIHQITPNVSYVGVNDRVTERFEAMWPLPYGVSYNSYLVSDEKSALIDTVEISFVEELISHIHETHDGGKLDYLVINHMEPDHSGSIPVLLKYYPELKLVGNKQTIGMVKGFYHIDDDSRFVEVGNGSTLSLGNLTLKFVLTPMVHWPETMMTYVEEQKLLFSGDAFGCFGALNGRVIDNEMPLAIYFEEMYRYYSNIVGKYGKFVQRALAACASLELDYICSTHGPVWHSHIKEVVDIYNRLSLYEPEEGVVIVYGSMYGNTAEIAEAMATALAARGIKNIIVHNAMKDDASYIISNAFRCKGLIVGSATYSMRLLPPIERFMAAMETREVRNKVFGAFGSFTWAPAAAVPAIEAAAKNIGMEPVATVVMKQGFSRQTLADVESFADKFVAAYNA